MNRVNHFFRYIGYISLSLLIGWFSNYSGDETDFILQISHNIIPLLVTILAFYVTILALILKELVVFKNQKGGNIKDVYCITISPASLYLPGILAITHSSVTSVKYILMITSCVSSYA